MNDSPRPEFDPRHSAAIRAMLGDVVAGSITEAGSAVARPVRPPRRSVRTTALVILAMLVALLATGTTALALTGGSLFGLPDSATAPATPTAAPTPTATPTPPAASIPSPSTPPNPTRAPSRVPAGCDELLPQSDAEAILGVPVVPTTGMGTSLSSILYTGERVGALSCTWSSGTVDSGYQSVVLLIVPSVSDSEFEQTIQREGIYIRNPEPEIGPDSYSSCEVGGAGTLAFCAFITRVNGFGVELSVAVSPVPTETTRANVLDKFLSVRDTALGFAPAAPPWQPEGPTVAGAADCEGLIPLATLQALLGSDDVGVYRADEGEYGSTPMFSGRQVGAYLCSWTDYSVNVGAGVLPGGAMYLTEGIAQNTAHAWVPAPDYPGEAYITELSEGVSQVQLAVDNAWITVSGPTELLPAITTAVVAGQTSA